MVIYRPASFSSLRKYLNWYYNVTNDYYKSYNGSWNNYKCNDRKREVRLDCKNISLSILILKGIMGSYMTIQLHWLIKLMLKILFNENTLRDILSKRWPLNVLMLKMISKWQFTCIYLYSTGTMYWCITNSYYCNFNCGCCCCCCYCSLWWVTHYIIKKVKIIVTMVIGMISSTMGIAIMLLLLSLLL